MLSFPVRCFLVLVPLFLVTILAEIAVSSGLLPTYLFASPSQVLGTLIENNLQFRDALMSTAVASLSGLGISILFGIAFAFIVGSSPTLGAMFFPYASFFQTVPIIAIAPLLVVWFGYGQATVVASSFVASVFPVIAGTMSGLQWIPNSWQDLFKVYQAKKTQAFFLLKLPASLPSIFSGIRIAAGLSVIGAIVGEFISGSGLGGLVDEARRQQSVDKVFASILLASLFGFLEISAIGLFNQILMRRWGQIGKETA